MPAYVALVVKLYSLLLSLCAILILRGQVRVQVVFPTTQLLVHTLHSCSVLGPVHNSAAAVLFLFLPEFSALL